MLIAAAMPCETFASNFTPRVVPFPEFGAEGMPSGA
jgi:hypothetical protein